jgi:hypothetical protein
MEVEIESIRPEVPVGTIFRIPYDENGRRLTDDERDQGLQILDLSPGAQVRIVNPDASNTGNVLVVLPERDHEGNFFLGRVQSSTNQFKSRWTLGRWYVTAFINGDLDQLPCVNAEPTFAPVTDKLARNTSSSVEQVQQKVEKASLVG